MTPSHDVAASFSPHTRLSPFKEELRRRHIEEALRLTKVYIENRLAAIEYWRRCRHKESKTLQKDLVIDLGRKLHGIAQSLPRGHPLFFRLISFVDNLDNIFHLPESVDMVREMHRELDPDWKTRSIVPEPLYDPREENIARLRSGW